MTARVSVLLGCRGGSFLALRHRKKAARERRPELLFAVLHGAECQPTWAARKNVTIAKFRARLYWIYRTYFNEEEQGGLDLPLGPQSPWVRLDVAVGLVLVSFVGVVLTTIYLWSVR
jgi:hypothetical protein